MDLFTVVRGQDDVPTFIQKVEIATDVFVSHFVGDIDLLLPFSFRFCAFLLQCEVPELVCGVVNEVVMAEYNIQIFFFDEVVDGARLPQCIESPGWGQELLGKFEGSTAHLGEWRHVAAVFDDFFVDGFRGPSVIAIYLKRGTHPKSALRAVFSEFEELVISGSHNLLALVDAFVKNVNSHFIALQYAKRGFVFLCTIYFNGVVNALFILQDETWTTQLTASGVNDEFESASGSSFVHFLGSEIGLSILSKGTFESKPPFAVSGWKSTFLIRFIL